MYLNRLANIKTSELDRSVFVRGPRQTGKSSYFKQKAEVPGVTINLLDTKLRQQYEREPWLLRERILAMKPLPKVILIDEIQLIPELLNEIHLMIEENGIHFIMTGSSARKLRKGGGKPIGGKGRREAVSPLIGL